MSAPARIGLRFAGLAILSAIVAFVAEPARAQDEVDRSIAAAVGRAAKARDEGHPDDMKREIAVAVQLAGEGVARRRGFAAQLVDHGFPELAIQLCRQTLRQAPDDVILHGMLGIGLVKTKKFAEAITELTMAANKQPGQKTWWVQLGRAHLLASQEAAALAAIDRAQALAPEDPEVLEVRAECEYRNMRLEQCEATCRKLLAKDPRNAMGWQLLIRVRRTQGKLPEAQATADDAVKVLGRHPDIVLERGLVLLAQNKNEDAVRDLREVAERLPTDPRPHLHLCKAYTSLGLVKDAAAAKARYLELSPDLPKTETQKSR
jgi:predicted Zn-dependent protease